MCKNWMVQLSLFLLVVSLVACAGRTETPVGRLSEAQAASLAWGVLEPNTSSHDRENWQVIEIRTVKGSEISAEFAGQPESAGCWMGPTPEPNRAITALKTYWYVEWAPKPAAPIPQSTENFSLTAPPQIPEPFMREAFILLDVATGEVAARRLLCVIY